MILSTLDKSRKGGAYEQIPSLVLGQRWTPQLNSRNMMKVVLCVWIEPYIENDLSFCVWPVHTPTTSKEVLTLSASTSPLPYTGNKSCIVNTILSVMPKHTVYIDPCMGSAEVFFRKPRAEKEILNDYNGDLVNLFRVIQNNEKLAYLLGRLYLSINGELAFKQNKDRLKGVPNILDDVIETSQIFYDASWEDIQNAAAFLENQVYSFSSTGQTFGIARRDMQQVTAFADIAALSPSSTVRRAMCCRDTARAMPPLCFSKIGLLAFQHQSATGGSSPLAKAMRSCFIIKTPSATRRQALCLDITFSGLARTRFPATLSTSATMTSTVICTPSILFSQRKIALRP